MMPPNAAACYFVKFIKDSISLQTWGSLATKAGGEVINADSY